MIAPTNRDACAQGCELQLEAAPEAVGAARRFVTATLRAWHVGEEVAETVTLVTSELMTNAVERTRLRTSWIAERAVSESSAVLGSSERVELRGFGRSACLGVLGLAGG
jgi:Histidine kinase-like ATPase domain